LLLNILINLLFVHRSEIVYQLYFIVKNYLDNFIQSAYNFSNLVTDLGALNLANF
jgi:hypothetical protein